MITLNVSGNIATDPIIRKTANGEVINFSVAHNERYTNANGQTVEKVSFIRCAIWNKPALAPLFYKGRPIALIGAIDVRIFNDRPEINCRVISFQVFGKANPANTAAAKEQPVNEPIPEPLQVVSDLPF